MAISGELLNKKPPEASADGDSKPNKCNTKETMKGRDPPNTGKHHRQENTTDKYLNGSFKISET